MVAQSPLIPLAKEIPNVQDSGDPVVRSGEEATWVAVDNQFQTDELLTAGLKSGDPVHPANDDAAVGGAPVPAGPSGVEMEGDTIILRKPAADVDVGLEIPSGTSVQFEFELADATVSQEGGDLVFDFEDGATLTLVDFLQLVSGDLIPHITLDDGSVLSDGDFTIVAQALADISTIQTAEGPTIDNPTGAAFTPFVDPGTLPTPRDPGDPGPIGPRVPFDIPVDSQGLLRVVDTPPPALPPLFTPSPDTVDFDNVVAGTYIDGTQYNGLASDDVVFMWSNQAARVKAGYILPIDFGGGDGNDTIIGRGDNDVLLGENGNDTLEGHGGADRLYGNNDNDVISGGSGIDQLFGGAGEDVLKFSPEDGKVVSSFVTENYNVNPVENIGDFDPAINSTNVDGQHISFDRYDGGANHDVVQGTNAAEFFTFEYAENAPGFAHGLSGQQYFGVEEYRLGGGDDVFNFSSDLAADHAGNLLVKAEAGDDIVYLNDHNDTAFGGAGNDVIDGGAGEDYLYGDDGNDQVFGNLGNDHIDGGAGHDMIAGGQGDDFMKGGTGNDTLFGNEGNDHLYGNDGNDTLYGNNGDDTIIGGLGADTIFGGDNKDYIEGNEGNDFINGESKDDIILGGLGDDVLWGGGSGSDTIYGGKGDDTIYGGDPTTGADQGGKADLLFGGDGNDSIFGMKGEDIIYGGKGSDFMDGGRENDTYVWLDGDIDTAFLDVIDGFGLRDKLDVSNVLDGFNSSSDLFDFVNFIEDGKGNVEFSVDVDGTGTNFDFVEVALLQDVNIGAIQPTDVIAI